MNVMIAGGLLILALFGAAASAFALRALWSFARRGPSVAQQAYEHGESVRTWWRAAPVSNMTENPRDGERYGMGGQTDCDVGDEFVEERAVYAR